MTILPPMSADEAEDRTEWTAWGQISGKERARRKVLMERTLAHRNEQDPIGITTAELIREARAERYGEDA